MLLLIGMLLIQSLGSLAYGILWPGESFVGLLYGGSKVLMMCLPVLAWKYFGISWRGSFRRVSWREGGWGIGLGIATCIVTGSVLWWLLQSGAAFFLGDARAQVEAFGIATPVAYLLFALGVSVAHSLFEEWYWRLTAVPLLERHMRFSLATFFGGVAFSLHHILILSLFTSWLWAIVLGLIVGAAGWGWSWLIKWRGHVWWAWASHIGADLAIFWVGWKLLVGG